MLLTLSLGHTPQSSRVTEHVVQTDVDDGGELFVPRLGVVNRASSLVQVSDDISCKIEAEGARTVSLELRQDGTSSARGEE